jgi:hypothetical protein
MPMTIEMTLLFAVLYRVVVLIRNDERRPAAVGVLSVSRGRRAA